MIIKAMIIKAITTQYMPVIALLNCKAIFNTLKDSNSVENKEHHHV